MDCRAKTSLRARRWGMCRFKKKKKPPTMMAPFDTPSKSMMDNESRSIRSSSSRSSRSESSVSLLPCWTPVTTRALQEQEGSSAWNVLDRVLSPVKHAALLKEVYTTTTVSEGSTRSILTDASLKLSRTMGDVQMESVLNLLMATRTNDDDDHHLRTTRGDKSRFLSREERSSREFQQSYPQLNLLLLRIQETVLHYVSPSNATTSRSSTKRSSTTTITLDRSRTSVQLAVYPGNGVSGYPKHCDRSHACRDEPQQQSTRTTPVSSSPTERVVTVIYYLTPADWDAEKDGGCLRLFGTSGNDSHHFDVPPYSNRLVVFRSDGVEHQVLPSHRRPRAAVTLWFYGTVNENGCNGDIPRAPPHTGTSIAPVLEAHTAAMPSLSPPLPLLVEDETSTSSSRKSIFVSIAAYRDSELAPTVQSLLSTAQHPARIFVGIVLQLDPLQDAQIQCKLDEVIGSFRASSRIRVLTLHARHAQGPCYARSLCQHLYQDEDYALQIDSHMRFRPAWDTYLIEQLESLQQQKNQDTRVMLTTYPVGYHLPNSIPRETRGTLLVPWKFDSDGMLRQRGRLMQNQDASVCHRLYAAGFNFSHGRVISDCPYNARLRHLFFGEELSMAVRLYTHGYDLYAPSQTVCYHLWSRAHRPTPLQDTKTKDEGRTKLKEQAQFVVREELLGRGSGLGTVRTAAEFGEALGVDFVQYLMDDDASLGGLQEADFVTGTVGVSFEPGSVQSKIASLTPDAHRLIASFLSEMKPL